MFVSGHMVFLSFLGFNIQWKEPSHIFSFIKSSYCSRTFREVVQPWDWI